MLSSLRVMTIAALAVQGALAAPASEVGAISAPTIANGTEAFAGPVALSSAVSGFAQNCKGWYGIFGHVQGEPTVGWATLQAKCYTAAGKERVSSIGLNDCFVNIGGVVSYAPGGKWLETCGIWNALSPPYTKLIAECWNGQGDRKNLANVVMVTVDVNAYVGVNADGNLVC